MLLALMTGECLYSMSRRALSLAAPLLKQQEGIGEKQIGTIASSLAAVYAISKFSAAVVTDHVSCRLLFCAGLVGTGLCNVFFGEVSSSLAAMSTLWALNGLFQGGGWPSAAKLMMAWYPADVRGSYWSMVSSGTNIGNGVAPLLLSWVMHHYGWRAGFQVAGAVSLFSVLPLFLLIRDLPEDAGIPEEPKEQEQGKQEEAGRFKSKLGLEGSPCTTGPIIAQEPGRRWQLLWNGSVWLYSMAACGLCFAINGLSNWGMLFLIETQAESHWRAGSCMFWFDAGGMLGAVTCGPAGDAFCRHFNTSRTLLALIYSVSSCVSIGVLWGLLEAGQSHYATLASTFFAAGFLLYSPKVMVGLMVRENLARNMVGSAGGVLELMSEAGTTCAGLPLGVVLHHYGWESFFFTLLAASLAVVAVLATAAGRTAASPGQRLVKSF